MKRRIKARIEDLKERFERLSARERVAVAVLGAVIGLLLLLGIGFWIGSSIDDLEQNNFDTREALRLLARHRERYALNQQREQELSRSIPTESIELNSYVDRAATAVGVKVGESSETKPVEGARYDRRGLAIKLNKVNIAQLAALITRLTESPGQLVQITRLSVNTRWNKHEELDVEMEVSTYVQRSAESRRGARRRGRRG